MTASTFARRPSERRAEAATWAGYRSAAFARQTGTLVVVVDGYAAGIEDSGDPLAPRWFSICDDHGTLVGHDTLALAKHHASDPAGWCETCADALFARWFDDYFGVADELDGGLVESDLSWQACSDARVAAHYLGLSYPPSLVEAEEFGLDNRERIVRGRAAEEARWDR